MTNYNLRPGTASKMEIFLNLRNDALLLIFYNIVSKSISKRIASYLFQYQSFDRHGLTPGMRIENAIQYTEDSITYHHDLHLPLWILRMDIRKIFEIHHVALMQLLRSRGRPDEYLYFISMLYTNQKASVHRISDSTNEETRRSFTCLSV